MNGIGGYLGMEFSKRKEYHDGLLRLNAGRNALEYILSARKYKRIYLPYYCCDVLLEPVRKLGLQHTFYHIDNQLEPVRDFTLQAEDCFLYVNYYGVKNDCVERLANEIHNLIVDNSQSFFSRPIAGVDTFYSCRKFFGVPDGAYLSTDTVAARTLTQDTSYNKCQHLLKNIDCGVEAGYADFQANEELLKDQETRQMSVLTATIMGSVDDAFCHGQRSKNFNYLHERLAHVNELKLNFSSVAGPMSYPLLISDSRLRKQLISEKIYIPDYWPNVREWAGKNMYEYYLSENLLSLPVDQRYTVVEMKVVADTILRLI